MCESANWSSWLEALEALMAAAGIETQEELGRRVRAAGGRANASAVSYWLSEKGGKPSDRNLRALFRALQLEDGDPRRTRMMDLWMARESRPEHAAA